MTTTTSIVSKMKSSIFQKLSSMHSGLNPSGAEEEEAEDDVAYLVEQYSERYGAKNFQRMCKTISQALHNDAAALSQLQRKCGSKEQAADLLKNVLTPNHIFHFLCASLGSDAAVMELLKQFQAQDAESMSARASERKLLEICENTLCISNFLRIFSNLISETARSLCQHANNITFEDSVALLHMCLAGDKNSIRRFLTLTKASSSRLASMLNSIKQGIKRDFNDLFKTKVC